MHVTSTQKDSVMTADYAWNAETVMTNLNPDYLDICDALKRIRLIKGYTLEDVELISNGKFTKEAVGSYERNSRIISLKRLLELCEVYQVSLYSIISHVMWDDPLHIPRRRHHGLRATT